MAPTRDALKINQTSIVLRSVQGFYAHVLVEPSYVLWAVQTEET
jgi:hypothetical protein